MTLRAPSVLTYLIGLLVCAALGGLLWLLLGGRLPGPLLLGLGLFLGHLIGSWLGEAAATARPVAGTPATTPATTHEAAATPAESGEIKSIYVGNIAFSAPREALQTLFEPYGKVISLRLMMDRATGRPRGYGFIEMEAGAAEAAIAALDGHEFFGRRLRVNEAKQRANG